MSPAFDPKRELIVVPASFNGPGESFRLTMAFDTGATKTILTSTVFTLAGYDQSHWTDVTWVVAASGAVFVHRVVVDAIRALGWQRTDFEVLTMLLSPGLRVDGLPGLDFFRDHVLTIDFNMGEIDMDPGPLGSATP